MTDLATLRRGRKSFEQRAWAESYRLLQAADRDAPLDAEDLERLAIAAHLVGRDDECETVTARAHHAFLARVDREGAARAAFWLGFSLMERGAIAPASGWFVRAGRLLDEEQLDCAVRGYLLIPVAIKCIVQGDPSAAHATFSQVAEIARRFADRDLASVACHGRGRALIRLGRIAEGVALLDEAMASVVAGEVTPLVAGDVYCSVLEGCRETFDLRRAYEWTASLTKWCATQPGLVRYRGECLLYRAEVLQLRGQWNEAARDAQGACELLISRAAAGAAFYRCGEIHRLRGDFTKAEEIYTRAHERGRKPQPGLSLLRLAQGQIGAAAASIRSALLDTQEQISRARMLPAAVEILLAADDLAAARAASAELSEIALAFGAPLLAAASAHAAGAVRLADGDIEAASTSLRQACETWRELEMPYEEAHTCLLLAAVCERRGDQDGRRLELEAARRRFKQLDAAPWLARIAGQSERASHQRIGSLSERETQVLRLLAVGKTNRAIAAELFISEKTVARHVSNIFDKLGVSSLYWRDRLGVPAQPHLKRTQKYPISKPSRLWVFRLMTASPASGNVRVDAEAQMYDAIIVGARCAGSPTAMLLARQGFKVLLVDRAAFPSDTMVAGDCVVGVRGHGRDANRVEERARMVIGADGVNSFVARAVQAAEYDVRPVEFTGQSAALDPPLPEMRALFAALHGNQDATNAFLSAITGAIPLPDFMSNENLGRIMAAAKDVEFHR